MTHCSEHFASKDEWKLQFLKRDFLALINKEQGFQTVKQQHPPWPMHMSAIHMHCGFKNVSGGAESLRWAPVFKFNENAEAG